jgi:poly-gamma-glutamate synthesis protein (capsule biosynthesis protein)
VPGRPGINGITIDEKLTVTREELDFIRDLSHRIGVNVSREIVRKEGYYPPLADNEAEFGTIKFTLGEETRRTLVPNKADMERLARSVREAKFAADYVMISIHSHQIDGDTKEDVPLFLSQIAHSCIDMGADAIIGHGPHLLRPIEIYKERPIFYSLGDFVNELYSVELAPAEFFDSYGLDANKDTVYDLLKKRSHNFTVGLMEDKKMMETIIPLWETDETGALVSLRLMPVELAMKGNKSEIGLPRKATDLGFIERLREISKPYGIEMKIENNGIITCKW